MKKITNIKQIKVWDYIKIIWDNGNILIGRIISMKDHGNILLSNQKGEHNLTFKDKKFIFEKYGKDGCGYIMNELDEKIKPLVDFLNTLPTVQTVGSCQGHDDGGDTGNFDEPYVVFNCTNNRVLGFLTSFRYTYEVPKGMKKEYNIHRPHLKVKWNISIQSEEDSEHTPEELKKDGKRQIYACYVLQPDYNSYEKPSHIYKDITEILKYYKWKWKRIKMHKTT